MSYNWYWDISSITAALKLPLHDFTQTHDEFLNNANNHWSILWNLESLKKKTTEKSFHVHVRFFTPRHVPISDRFLFLSPTNTLWWKKLRVNDERFLELFIDECTFSRFANASIKIECFSIPKCLKSYLTYEWTE